MFVLFNIKLDDDPLTLIPSIIFGDNSILVAPARGGRHQHHNDRTHLHRA